tara:strand:- start:160 stop:1320 length:1161 start_codon:yes stop_codon:yes gene_type:complete
MKDKISIYYWSPFITHVATVNAVLNSASAFSRYSKKNFDTSLINVAGEWDQYKGILKEKNINLIQLTNSKIINNSNFTGYLKSRAIYLYISIISFLPLINLLRKNPPVFFVIHLITPLPLIINFLFKLKTKFILRISGFPRFNIIRKIFWKITLKKMHHITCPTNSTKMFMQKLGIIDANKISVLHDPIINSTEIMLKKKEKINNSIIGTNYYIAIGRLTKQKNFEFLISVFKDFLKFNKNKLIILGDGEERNNLTSLIKKNGLDDKILLLGFKKNVFKYLKNSKCFILSSLWEDPGFVLIESAYMNIPIISSDCENGPKEILNNGEYGILFKSNDKKSLMQSLLKFEKMKNDEIFLNKVNSKKNTKKFSYFRHYRTFSSLIKKIL